MALGQNARWHWGCGVWGGWGVVWMVVVAVVGWGGGGGGGIVGRHGGHFGITGQLGAISKGVTIGGMMGGITGSRRSLDCDHWSKMMPGMKGLSIEKIFHGDVKGGSRI